MIDNVVGIASLPVGLLLFGNVYGWTKMNSFFGISMLTIAAIVLVLIQLSNIMGAHIIGENVFLSYIIHFLLIIPSVIYFLSLLGVGIPGNVVSSFPILFASFITLEGLYSFFF